MGVPKYFQMYKPILQFLSDGNNHSMKELKGHVSQYFHMTAEDLAELLPSGRQTYFSNRIGWARTYLKKAGLLDSPAKGVLCLTAEGQRVCKEQQEILDNAYLMQFDSFREFIRSSSKSKQESEEKEEEETPDDILESAFEKINQSLADDLLSEIMKIPPLAFEKMVLDLMRKMGYGTFANAAMTTAVTGDEGIDGIIMEDKLEFDLIYVQVKHWGSDHLVGRPDVQAFVGAIAGKGGKGLFVTTSQFTKQAIEYAKHQHVILMDGRKLAQFMIEYDFGVTTKKTFAIKNIDSDFFDEYQDESV